MMPGTANSESGRLPLIAGPVYAQVAAGVPLAYQIATTTAGTAFSATGLAGLTIGATTGILSGTPTAKSYAIVITATNAAGSSTGELALVAQ